MTVSRCSRLLPLLLALSVLPWSGSARADKPARMTVFIMSEGEVPAKVSARISHAFVRTLRNNPNLEVKDPDKLLVEFAGEMPTEAINRAQKALDHGLKLLTSQRAAEAIESFNKAIAGFEPTLAFIKKNSLADSVMALGVATAMTGNRKGAVEIFENLLVWRPHMPYDTKRFDPKYQPLFDKAKQTCEELPRGSVELTTDPPGAKAYIDGQFVGVTPTVAYGLTVGNHYATYKMAGYVKAAQKVLVSPKVQKKFSQELTRSEKFLLLEQTLKNVNETLGAAEATPPMADLRSFLFIDQVIFARLTPLPSERVEVRAFLYDLRTRQRLKQASSQIPLASPNKPIDDLTRVLYLNVRYDGTLEAPPEPAPPPPPKRTPFYATWWFWTAVGVGVAGIVLPIVLWPDSKDCADNYRCVTVQN